MTDMIIVRGHDGSGRALRAHMLSMASPACRLVSDVQSARAAIDSGCTVIVDAPFIEVEKMAPYRELARRCGHLIIYETSDGLEPVPEEWGAEVRRMGARNG